MHLERLKSTSGLEWLTSQAGDLMKFNECIHAYESSLNQANVSVSGALLFVQEKIVNAKRFTVDMNVILKKELRQILGFQQSFMDLSEAYSKFTITKLNLGKKINNSALTQLKILLIRTLEVCNSQCKFDRK